MTVPPFSTMTNSSVDHLNRRLGEALGLVCGGSLPRFAWKWAPDQPHYVFDRDNRTLLKRTWADAPAPGGGVLGGVWVLAGWRENRNYDNFGYGDSMRIPVVHSAGYAPYFETALVPGQTPTAELNQNYIWALDRQLQASSEHSNYSFDNYMNEEHYSTESNKAREKEEWREQARTGYDANTGAFGNCEPGKRDGFFSFQNVESGAEAPHRAA